MKTHRDSLYRAYFAIAAISLGLASSCSELDETVGFSTVASALAATKGSSAVEASGHHDDAHAAAEGSVHYVLYSQRDTEERIECTTGSDSQRADEVEMRRAPLSDPVGAVSNVRFEEQLRAVHQRSASDEAESAGEPLGDDTTTDPEILEILAEQDDYITSGCADETNTHLEDCRAHRYAIRRNRAALPDKLGDEI